MAIFVANENGDWWEITPDSLLWAIKTEDIPAEFSPDDDKFEQTIQEYGSTITGFYKSVSRTLDSAPTI